VAALGLRNPYRLTFDAAAGDLWVADVGHQCMEEVDRMPAGVRGTNFGWNRFEGTRDFLGGDADAFETPVYAYPHTDDACAVIGGAVPRGPDALAALRGAYVFGDFCSGEVSALRREGDAVVVSDLGVDVGGGLLSVTTGPTGTVYVLSIGHGIQRLV
jgi:glucose/arabinose dehydrogenase